MRIILFKFSDILLVNKCRCPLLSNACRKHFVTSAALSHKLVVSPSSISHHSVVIPALRNFSSESSPNTAPVIPNAETDMSSDIPRYLDGKDVDVLRIIARDMTVHENFITPQEEESLLKEIDPYLKRLKYEYDHWDDAIHGYRETEKGHWKQENKAILARVQKLAFPPDVPLLKYIHVLDLAKNGYIKPHVDSIRFCGPVIAGLCLLSSCVMRLVNESDKNIWVDVLLQRHSLYIMKGEARYKYTHEILKDEESLFKGQHVPRDRRISVICRNEPLETDIQ